jgi:predicted nucleic acid-binding protein
LFLPDADVLIAATAYEKTQFLVTGNTSHFERFPGLQLQDWIH